jgi:hypothetical protein
MNQRHIRLTPRIARAGWAAITLALSLVHGAVRAGDGSPIQAYYDFLYWFSAARYDRALEQFAADAVVIGGAGCSADLPCIGREAIRRNYFAALFEGRLPLPWADQQYDGSVLRTHGDAGGSGHHGGGRRNGYTIVARHGKIVLLIWRPTVAHASAALDAPP